MQQLNPSEISDIIKERIARLDVASEARNEGTIVSVSDGIVRIHGLADVQNGEMIEFPGNLFGFALNLERDSVGAVVLGDYKGLEKAKRLGAPDEFWKCPLAQSSSAEWWMRLATRSTERADQCQCVFAG